MATVNITIDIADAATPGNATNRLRKLFDDERGEVLARLAQATPGSTSDIERILAALADAVLASESS